MRYRLGLIAKDIHNSVTPHVYGAFARALGVEISFDIFNVMPEQLYDTVNYAKENLNGFNVTMPYKQRMLDFADDIDESSKKCGSTNVILVKDKKLIAYNTDGWGFIKALQLKGFYFEGKKVVMVGAGGVALSIAYNLGLARVRHVDVINKYPDETQQLCTRFGQAFQPHELSDESLYSCCKDADYFINASVLGQVGYDDYADLGFLSQLKRSAVVYDVNYSNTDANLPKAAKEAGLGAYNGKSMTACQGIRAMEFWTGRAPSDEAARQLVEEMENS